jgi:hypothetical protein
MRRAVQICTPRFDLHRQETARLTQAVAPTGRSLLLIEAQNLRLSVP